MKLALEILFIVISIVLTIVILCQEGKDAGLSGSISGGGANTYWQKNKGRSKQGALEKATKILGAFFILVAILLQIKW